MDERLKEAWESCVKCGLCRDVCPVFREEKAEPFVARGHIALLSEFMKGKIDFSGEKSKDYLYKCLLCATCVEACPNSAETDTVVEIARLHVSKRHGLPLYKRVMGHVLKNRELMDFIVGSGAVLLSTLFKSTKLSREAIELPGSLLDRLIPPMDRVSFINKYAKRKRGRVALFPGCLINYSYRKVGDDFVYILGELGIDFVVPEKQMCCGGPVYFAGNFKDAEYLARKNVELFLSLDVEHIIVLEPTCLSVMKFDYPKLAMYLEDKELEEKTRKVAARMIDPVKFLYENTNLIRMLGNLDVNTTYHDPCHLKRTQGIKNEPRDFLRKISRFREMKNADRCCGNGGTFSVDYRELSLRIGSRKFEWIAETEADYLVTGCSACMMQLSEILHRYGRDDIKTVHTIELIKEALEVGV